MTEFSQYNVLKEAVRAKLTRKPSHPNVDKIRKEVRGEVEEEFRKKNKRFQRRFELKFEIFISALRVTRDLRDVTQKMTKPWSGVLGGFLFCLAPARTFRR